MHTHPPQPGPGPHLSSSTQRMSSQAMNCAGRSTNSRPLSSGKSQPEVTRTMASTASRPAAGAGQCVGLQEGNGAAGHWGPATRPAEPTASCKRRRPDRPLARLLPAPTPPHPTPPLLLEKTSGSGLMKAVTPCCPNDMHSPTAAGCEESSSPPAATSSTASALDCGRGGAGGGSWACCACNGPGPAWRQLGSSLAAPGRAPLPKRGRKASGPKILA
jgi:hypothetical protein